MAFILLAIPSDLNTSKAQVTIQLPWGVTDVEIQSRLDSLPDSGGEVLLPAGTIEVGQPIVLKRSHQTLRGWGPATVLRLADNANCPVIIMGEPANQPSKTVEDVHVASVFIDGNRFHQQRELWKEEGECSEIRNNGITIQRVSHSSVKQVISARCRSGGVVTTLGVTRLEVRGLEAFDNEFDGLACYLTTNSLFADLNLHNNPGAGISLDLDFNNNIISNAVLKANDLGIFMRASRGNQFNRISIHDSRNHGVFMAHVSDEVALPTACTKNTFTNIVASNCGGAAFRINNSSCRDNTVAHAKFEKNRKGDFSLAHPELLTVR